MSADDDVDPGMTIREDGVIDADVTLTDPNWAPSKLHRALFDSERLGGVLIRAVQDLAAGKSAAEFRSFLAEIGVTALDGTYADLCVAVARGDRDALFELHRATRQLGSGQTSLDLRSPRADIPAGVLPILRASEVTPTVAVTIGQAFRDSETTRAGHRRDSLALLRELADGCRVILVAPRFTQTFLWTTHRDELPPSVESACNPYPRGSLAPPAIETVVDDARAALAHSNKPTRILEQIGDEPAEVLTYTQIERQFTLKRGTVRTHAQRLRGLGLVTTINWYGDAALSLTPAGMHFVRVRRDEIGRQATLDTCVDETGICQSQSAQDDERPVYRTPDKFDEYNKNMATGGQNTSNSTGSGDTESIKNKQESCVERTRKVSKYSRVSTAEHESPHPTYTDRRQVGELITVEYMPRSRHAAITGAATDGAITLVDHPIEETDDHRQPYLSYDDDCLVVGSSEYIGPLQWWVCIARALTDHRVFRDVLTPDRLDGDGGGLSGLLTDDTRLLRDARCLGYLKDSDANGADFADALMDANDELLTLLTKLKNGDYDDRNAFRGEILRLALGLAGTVSHLCDLVGVNLVREARLSESSRRFSPQSHAERRADLCETISKGASIASRHGHFAAYRQLFEGRPEKRAAAMEPMIPADRPTGELIGSFVIVGENASGYTDELREGLGDMDVHEGAPEFDIPIPIIDEQGRAEYASVARHILDKKIFR